MKNLIIVVFLFSIFACNSTKPNENSTDISKDSIAISVINQEKESVQIFDTLSSFRIISSRQISNYPSSDPDTAKCSNWILSKESIKQIIQSSRLINGHEWHYIFSHLPCAAKGQLKQNELTYDFSINSGSWMTIGNSDTTIMLGYFDSELAGLFLDDHWTEDEE
ncbi:hypothetical protein [Fulvivirga sp.]|uniref:hypothetical protein n=1 Tax=Fulvivirga sp. TaxID=1931237 RepID=UPI0032EC05C8